MSKSMKQVEVSILGQTYVLACPDGAQVQLSEAVARVDREMGTIRTAGKVKSRERIAVLAALNIAFADLEPSTNAQADGSSVSAADARLASLIDRIDVALGAGGQLL